MKKIAIGLVLFVVFILLYFLPGIIFMSDSEYYNSLIKPFYAPSSLIFGIVWPILYSIFSIYLSVKIVRGNLSTELITYFVINYIISFFFNKVFFVDKNLFLSFVITFLCFITSIFMIFTAYKQTKKEALVFVPYLLWTLYASILIVHIYFIN